MKVILAEQGGKGGGGSSSIILKSIEVTAQPNTTTYVNGASFDRTGMEVTASYGMKDSAAVLATAVVGGYTVTPDPLTDGTTYVTISYSENGVTATTTLNVTVIEGLTGIVITQNPTGTQTYNQAVDTTGMIVTASYSNGTSNTITGYTITSPSSGTWSSVGSQTLTVSYSENGITQTASCTVNVQQAKGEFTLSATEVSIGGSNYSSGVEVTVTTESDGIISAVSSNSTACPISVNGKVITIKGNGSTTGTYTVTVSMASTTNYTAAEDQTITVTIVYWEWGDETATADADWWAALKSWLKSSTEDEREACLGKTKSVTLSSTVLGATTHLVQCIGYDCDGTGTLTFQTKNCLPTTTVFGSSDAVWYNGSTNSTARTQCINYYNAFPGKESIEIVSKKYCSTYYSTHNGGSSDKTYDETVFLPSEPEMGLNTYSVANDEFCTENTNKIAYQYYSANDKRIKYQSDSSTSTAYYWERSRSYNSSNYVCSVGSSGAANNYNYDYSYYLAPAFVI